jgi:hypothetical protein
MGVSAYVEFAERLRAWIAGNACLPLGLSVTLDGALSQDACLDLQINQGRTVKTYLDGTKIVTQPFTLIYRARATEDFAEKSYMIGILNEMGAEMERTGPPDFGPEMGGISIEMEGSANIAEQDHEIIGYAAVFVLRYEQYPV